MQQFVEVVRPWLELLFFLSGAVLAAAAVYGLKQVSLLKRDFEVRNERAAKEKATEYAQRYLSNYVRLYNGAYAESEAKGLRSYEGVVGGFDNFRHLEDSVKEGAIERGVLFLSALNELQSIAAAYATGVADEGVGFEIIGRTFCASVRSVYDVLTLCRGDNAYPYYQSIVDLYGLWRPRLKKGELAAVRDKASSLMDGSRIPRARASEAFEALPGTVPPRRERRAAHPSRNRDRFTPDFIQVTRDIQGCRIPSRFL